jgi:hypothetical protein
MTGESFEAKRTGERERDIERERERQPCFELKRQAHRNLNHRHVPPMASSPATYDKIDGIEWSNSYETKYSLKSFGKSTPPHNRQLIVYFYYIQK